jgi:hypothetical protein
MNINRLTPREGEDLPTWLSGVVYDAIRDAKTAGMSEQEAWMLISIIARSCDPSNRGLVHESRLRFKPGPPDHVDVHADYLEAHGHLEAAETLRGLHG